MFILETKIKENAHKIERLHDYERQIEHLIKMQRLWFVVYPTSWRYRSLITFRETDVHTLNEQTEYIKVFTSNYKKMELRLESYEKTQIKMDEEAK